jgi:DNA modification methylase
MDSRLALEGRADWIQTDPVLPSVKVHQAEKPIALLKELISRTCFPGSYILDPFTGSGSIIEAACELKMFAIGCELSTESYATALARMVRWKESNNE